MGNLKKILVVDDDAMIRESLEAELRRNYFETVHAATGKEAIEMMAQSKPDIAILDVSLPDMGGLDVLEEIKKINPDCEVIIITGYGSEEVAVQSLRRGAIDYIEKPLDLAELQTSLGRALESLGEKEDLAYKHSLLVIDDDETTLKLLVRFLEKENFQVFRAMSGKEGLKVVEDHKIDVLISDIQMEDMDGITVLERAKRLYADIEGIMVTGHGDGETAVKALRAGAADYITKPVELEELLYSVKKIIERVNLKRNKLYRARELKISKEIISKMNEELERRIAERSKELDKTQAQLFQTSKLATLGEMAAGLAHEINQPLGGISLTVTTLKKLREKEKLTDEIFTQSLKDIDSMVDRMTRIIKHIRIFARQDTLKFVEVDLRQTLDSAMSLLAEQLRMHEIQVEIECPQDLPKVTGEPYQLEQVWINMMANARDAMDIRGERIKKGELPLIDGTYRKKLVIRMATEPDKNAVRVSFTDNGVGISEENKKKVLEPFFTTKEVGKATGLGLSISYGIIENHKGQIEIESKEFESTTMTIVIPVGGDSGKDPRS